MDDDIFSPAINGPSFASNMDFDYVNELLGDGCWLETVQGGSDFLQQGPSDSGNYLNSQFLWSPSETPFGENIFGQIEESIQDQFVRSNLPGSSRDADVQQKEQAVVSLADASGETGELGRRWWIGPRPDTPKISVMERLVRAIGYIKELSEDKNVLIQIWVPIDLNGRRVLTTNDQPYIVDSNSASLASYRNISLDFQFSAEKNSNIAEGMPGRVFLGKVPEWTPDVRFFRTDEYSRVGYAQRHNVRGTLALPVFDRGSQTCLGVIEVVTTTQTVKTELDSVCKALQAVDLCSAESPDKAKTSIHSYRAAIPEILEVMKATCLAHKLPLAQTWMPCNQQGKEGCRHSSENYVHCVSTVDDACCVSDSNVQGFQEACSEHHLLRGQGVAGKAFTTNEPCFFDDITLFSKTEYPLSHHARMFGLHAAVAIRLRSVQTGAADFVLEFFLPTDCREPEDHKKMLGSLSSTIQKTCRSLRVVTSDELAKNTVTSVSASVVPSNYGVEALKMNRASSDIYSHEMTTLSGCVTNQSRNVAAFIQKEEPTEFIYEHLVSSFEDYNTFGEGSFRADGTENKIRSKAEKTITLEVLQRHFAGSLKDAATSLGVCPTTLKRICRNQGIKRWPSRKIKKVGHSLEKLQRVIDSVQGPSGTFQIGSFYSNFPELASPSNKSGITNQFSAAKVNDVPKSLSVLLSKNAASSPMTSISPSTSFSQSSNSSASSASHHKTSSWNSTKDANVRENADEGSLKRTRSDAHLDQLSQEDPKLLPRSRSHVTLSETLITENPPSLPQNVRKELDGTRVKISYGDDNIRIRMHNRWQLEDLRQEIARRFNVECSSEMQLKYLDDESEWVLLTCETDWEECLHVCLSTSVNTIKLSLLAPPHHLGASLVSRSLP